MSTTNAMTLPGGAWSVGAMEATITHVEPGHVIFRPTRGGCDEGRARVAVLGYAASVGDRVLVQPTSDANATYVIGVIHSASATSAQSSKTITTPHGARVTVEGDSVAIHSEAGALIASYDSATGELRLCAEGDLRLSAPHGRAILEGAQGIEVGGGQGRLTIQGGDAVIRSESTSIHADRVEVEARVSRWAVAEWDLRAERVVERAKNVFRHVDGLLETRAKRLRTLVATTLELRGRRTTVISEKDTRIDGERVLLG